MCVCVCLQLSLTEDTGHPAVRGGREGLDCGWGVREADVVVLFLQHVEEGCACGSPLLLASQVSQWGFERRVERVRDGVFQSPLCGEGVSSGCPR